MKKKIRKISAFIFWMMFLTGCTEDGITRTEHPDRGKVTIITDWSMIGSGIRPSAFTVGINGSETEVVTDYYTYDDFFEPGIYKILSYNKVPEIDIRDGVAVVKSISGSTIESMPGWLFVGRLEANVMRDMEHEFSVIMMPQLRRLNFIIETGDDISVDVERVSASLSGVAGAVSILDGNHGSPSDVEMNFVKDSDGKWKAGVRLLGITGDVQNLEVVCYDGNNQLIMTKTYILGGHLKDFNANKNTPLTLTFTTLEAELS